MRTSIASHKKGIGRVVESINTITTTKHVAMSGLWQVGNCYTVILTIRRKAHVQDMRPKIL
jgi:hypothetical protein